MCWRASNVPKDLFNHNANKSLPVQLNISGVCQELNIILEKGAFYGPKCFKKKRDYNFPITK